MGIRWHRPSAVPPGHPIPNLRMALPQIENLYSYDSAARRFRAAGFLASFQPEWCATSWLWVEPQSADLQTERKLLPVVVARVNLNRIDFQGERVFLDFVKEPGDRLQAAERVGAAFVGHVIVGGLFPLRLDGRDADPAVLRPAIKRAEHCVFSGRDVFRQRVRVHAVPPVPDRPLAVPQLRALNYGLSQLD